MQPVDSFDAEPGEFVCLLSFGEDGTIRWSSSIGNVPRSYMRRMVHVFRASRSISSAFLKVMEHTAPSDNSSRDIQQNDRSSENATLVKCQKNAVILAKQIHHTSDSWFALLGKPLDLQDDTICNDMLSTLEELASILFPSTCGDHDNLYELCEAICASITSIPFWSDGRRVTHFLDSLVKFCSKQMRQQREQRLDDSDHFDPMSNSGLQTVLLQSLESFYTEVGHHYGASQVRLCLLNPDNKPLYSEKLRRQEIVILGWYFSTCLNLGFRAFSNIFFDRDKCGVLRIWYKRHGLILFTSFSCTKEYTGNPSRSFRNAADALIEAASHAYS